MAGHRATGEVSLTLYSVLPCDVGRSDDPKIPLRTAMRPAVVHPARGCLAAMRLHIHGSGPKRSHPQDFVFSNPTGLHRNVLAFTEFGVLYSTSHIGQSSSDCPQRSPPLPVPLRYLRCCGRTCIIHQKSVLPAPSTKVSMSQLVPQKPRANVGPPPSPVPWPISRRSTGQAASVTLYASSFSLPTRTA